MEKDNLLINKILCRVKSNQFKIIYKEIKDNIWLTPVIYIIGTLVVLLRNKMFGLQFTNISLLHLAVISVYVLFFIISYSLAEYIIYSFKTNNNVKSKLVCCIRFIFIYTLYLFIIIDLLSFLTDNIAIGISITFVYLILWPIIMKVYRKLVVASKIVTIIMFMILIMQIPLNMGGFKGQEVIFHSYSEYTSQKYMYYGTYDGLYQLTSHEKVFLIPIDSGYLEYQKN